MTVGQIQRNYIQDNSVGIGFFGYSGFSGWSGWSGPTGPAGGINVSAGKYAWVMDVGVLDNALRYPPIKNTAQYSAWGIWAICGFFDQVPPGTYWADGDSTATGFTTKVRVRAVMGVAPANSGDLYALRMRKLTAASVDYPWEPSMASYADNNLLVTDNLHYTFWGTVVPNSEVSVYCPNTPSQMSGASGEYELMPSHMVGPWCTLSGDGFYMVEVWDWHTGTYYGGAIFADKIFLEFAKVKN